MIWYSNSFLGDEKMSNFAPNLREKGVANIIRKNIEYIKKHIVSKMSYIRSNQRAIRMAASWLLFMLFFTYTSLIVELFEVEGDFLQLFYTEQRKYVSLFVNTGIVIMLLFDYSACEVSLSPKSYRLPFVAIVCCLALMAHCDLKMENQISQYRFPINLDYLSVIIYGFFVLLVYQLKLKVLTPDVESVKKGVN